MDQKARAGIHVPHASGRLVAFSVFQDLRQQANLRYIAMFCGGASVSLEDTVRVNSD